MVFKSRKFFIWLVSLVVVLAIYLVYIRISETPQIDIDTGAKSTGIVGDSNVGGFDREIGMIGDVGVESAHKAKYAHLDKNKEVDREFGFEKLLYERGDEWGIEKPFMNIFRRGFKCYITADRGKVQVEAGLDRPRPRDATLTGNVVIHIVPETGSNVEESHIYLDDIIFISEESQFSSAGPVKFVSQNAQMLGRGLELVYNEELDRLEFLRIIHLETLRLKASSESFLLSSPETAPAGSERGLAGAGTRVQTERPVEPVAVGVPQDAKAAPTVSTQVVEQAEGERYKCVFSKNVVVDSPQQLIFADELFINNIISGGKSTKKTDVGDTDSASVDNVTVAKQSEPKESSEQFADIVVTCDNGILVTPMGSSRALENFAKLNPEATVMGGRGLKNFGDARGRPTFAAQRIDYDHSASTRDVVASGSSELIFYANNVMGAETAVPVEVTAQKKAKFMPALNQAVFEGDSLCTMIRADSGIRQKHTLSAPKLTVDLSRDKSEQSSAFAAGIEHLTATGGNVKLATVKETGEKFLGGVELKCRRFDYDTAKQLLLATGPGIIKVDNSNVASPKKRLGKFSLQRQYYAIVRDFETLKYFLEANQIVADARRERILIDYFPITRGRYGQQVAATAGHVEALLYETAGGRAELSTLSATGGVSYEEEGIQFEGSEMFCDHGKSVIKVWGDESRACILNGALVDGIEYDLKTGKARAKIVGPGIVQPR